MSEESKLPSVCAGEIADAIKNGLANEYDDGTWGMDLTEDEDPIYEDILPDSDIEAVIRLTAGKQEFIITVKEVRPNAKAIG